MHNRSSSAEQFDPRPDGAMGGANDAGAGGGHPVSSAEAAREGRSPLPDEVPGDSAIERRRRVDPDYHGPERRMSMR